MATSAMVRTSLNLTSNHPLIDSTTMKIKSIMKAVLLLGVLTFATASCTNKNDEPVIETNQYIHKGVVAGKTEMKIDVKTIYIIHFFDGQRVYRIVVDYDKYMKLKKGMVITADIRDDINYRDEELAFD
nr:MAG TPA: hypothetical protein [Caudoviricetes sp.]